MSQNIELVIFDWDGTLFDSVGQIVASLQYAAQQFEQPLTDDAAKSIIGLGLPEVMLADLKQQGLKLAVATGKSRKGLDRVLTQTHSHEIFDITRAASETKSKPDPLMLQEILAELDVAVECAIMVGDTSYDLEMARNLNMPRIGVSYGVHSIETLQQYQPLTIAHNVQDLHAYLQNVLEQTALTEG